MNRWTFEAIGIGLALLLAGLSIIKTWYINDYRLDRLENGQAKLEERVEIVQGQLQQIIGYLVRQGWAIMEQDGRLRFFEPTVTKPPWPYGSLPIGRKPFPCLGREDERGYWQPWLVIETHNQLTVRLLVTTIDILTPATLICQVQPNQPIRPLPLDTFIPHERKL